MNKKNQPHPGQAAKSESAKLLDVGVPLVVATRSSQTKKMMSEKSGYTEEMTGKGVQRAQRKETASKKAPNHVGTSKAIASNIAPKASSSKNDSTSAKVKPEPTHAVAKSHGKAKAQPVKRKMKAEESAEGPAKKKLKVFKDLPTSIEHSLSVDTDESMADVLDSEKVRVSRSTQPVASSSSKATTNKMKRPSHTPASSGPSSTRPPIAIPSLEPSRIAELQGMIIESFAVSRASSLPPSCLYTTMSNNRPSLKTERSKEEWLSIIEWALEDGQNTSEMFGKVESSFKVTSPLEHVILLC